MPPIAQSFFGLNTETTAEAEAERETDTATSPRNKDSPRTASIEIPRNLGTRECDFDKDPSDLYLELQKKDWDAAISRAHTDPTQAHTWVVRKEFDGKLRWRLLPLHAAIILSLIHISEPTRPY